MTPIGPSLARVPSVGGSWLSLLTITDLDDGKNWLLEDVLKYLTSEGIPHDVPKHFVTDLASVMWPLRKVGKINKPAVLHDYMYRTPSLCWNRWYADKIFHESMIAADVPRVKADMFYLALRLGGWRAWNRYRRDL